MSAITKMVTQILNDDNLQQQTKLEDFLAVAAGARPAAMLLVPADFPDAESIKNEIDNGFRSRYYHGRRHSGITAFLDTIRYGLMRAFMNPLKYKASLLREAFEDSVFAHSNYKAHRQWAKKLGLQTYETQVRPSLDEMYLAPDDEKIGQVAAFQQRREEIRREVVQQRRQQGDMQVMLLPEEQSSEYLTELGSLLGYPQCCIDAYIDDVAGGVDSALRASNQLSELEEADESDPSAEAYFASTFFPCTPECTKASETGEKIVASLGEMDERLPDYMSRAFRANMDFVRKYPQIRQQRREQMMSKYLGVMDNERGPSANGR